MDSLTVLVCRAKLTWSVETMNDPIDTCNVNVPDCAPEDQPVLGPYTYELPPTRFVAMESASIYSLGYNLAGRLTDYDTRAQVIAQQLDNSSISDSSEGSVRPLGRDQRYVHVQNAVTYHEESMAGTKELMNKFREGMDNLSRLTRIIVHEIGGVDAQSAMTMEQLEAKTGLNAQNATRVEPITVPGQNNP